MVWRLFIAAAAFLVFTGNAHAYLDPGTGSYFFQLLAAGFLGGLFTVKMFWTNIKTILKKPFRRGGNDKGETQ